jgi:threonine/homoserine/homoserine lactone efflux protein
MIAFLAVAVIVIVSPGPDFALTVRNTLVGGRRAGLATALGVIVGQLVWGVATAAGLAALLVASHPAFVALRFAGAAYLVWLGLQSLRGSHDVAVTHRGSGFRQGLLSNLGNPKMAIFFASLLPQFGDSFGALIGHSVLFSCLTLAWLAVVVRLGDVLRIPRVRRAVDVVTGVALVAFGLRLATEPR